MSGRWGYQRDGIPPPARHDQPRPVGRTAEEPGHGGELGEPGRQVRHYFREDRDLKDYSTARGWQDKYASVADLHTQATFTFLEQPRDDRYGILRTRRFAGHQLLDELLEKPSNYDEPTAYINISRTLLPAHALAHFQKLTPAPNGEYQATDAVIAFARDHDVLIHPVAGEYHDCGNPAGWLAANNAAAQSGALAG